MTAYFNENEPFAARWLENLMVGGRIPLGTVDKRSIADVTAADLAGFTQCHFFAGIGGWSRALELAGVPHDFPVWTGSCPCQPFSSAGAGKGFDDDRHLWPTWRALIEQCLPPIIFGEQVASPAGREWLDVVSADLEALGYAVGAADLCAASLGAPHIRQRLWFAAVRLADDHEDGRGEARGVEHADDDGGGRDGGAVSRTQTEGGCERVEVGGLFDRAELASAARGYWGDAEWLACRDGRARPVEPGAFPLAHGVPGRVGRVRAYGNAIVPQVAAAFIEAVMETQV